MKVERSGHQPLNRLNQVSPVGCYTMAGDVVKWRPGQDFYPVNPRQGAQIGEMQSLIGLFPPQLPKEQHSRRVVILAPTTNRVHCGNAGARGKGGGFRGEVTGA